MATAAVVGGATAVLSSTVPSTMAVTGPAVVDVAMAATAPATVAGAVAAIATSTTAGPVTANVLGTVLLRTAVAPPTTAAVAIRTSGGHRDTQATSTADQQTAGDHTA